MARYEIEGLLQETSALRKEKKPANKFELAGRKRHLINPTKGMKILFG